MKKIIDYINEGYKTVKDLTRGSIAYFIDIDSAKYYKDIFAMPSVNGRFKVNDIEETDDSVKIVLTPISTSGKQVKLSIPKDEWIKSNSDIIKWSNNGHDYELSVGK